MSRLFAALILLAASAVAQFGVSGEVNTSQSGSSGNATQIQAKAVDVPSAAGQQTTYNGTKFIQQSKAVIDVRDIAGVDCTGATDSSAALNALTDGTNAAVDGRTIELEPCIAQGGIRLNHIWWVQKFTHGVTLHLGPKYGSGGHTLFACSVDSAPTGLSYVPVILFSRIFKPSVIGGFIESFGGTGSTKCGGGGTSTATAGVGVENDYTSNPGGVTTTQGKFEDTLYMPNGGGAPIANWQGIVIGGSSINSQNLEGMRVIGNWIHGQNSSGSIGVNINGQNSDHGIAQSNIFASLKYAFRMAGPEWAVDSNVTSGVGDYAVFGGGAFITNLGTGGHTVFSNNEHAERSGQFFSVSDGAGGPSFMTFDNNYFGGIDSGALQAGVSNITCGACGNFTFRNNRGQNMNGAPVVAYTYNNGSGGIFRDLGNDWLSNAFTIDVTKSAAYEGFDRLNVRNLKLQTIPSAPAIYGDNISPGTPAVDFLNVKQNGGTPSRYLMRGMSSAGSTDALVIANLATQGTPSMAIGPKLAGGLVTQAAAAVTINYVQNVGTAGSTTWGYKLFGYTSGGLGNLSAELTTTTGNATLTSGNYNRIISTGIGPEYWKTCLYRTTGGSAGFIGAVYNILAPAMSLPGTFGFGGDNGLYLADSGQAADSSGTICPAAVPTSTANGSANIPTGATYQINSTQISAANLSNGTTGTAGTAVVLATSPTLTTPNIGAATTGNQITSTLATGTAPFSIASTTPVANLTAVPLTYNHSGTQQIGTHLVVDSCTLGTDCSVTLAGAAAFTSSSSYSCVCQDETAMTSCKVAQTSGSAFAIVGRGSDTIRYFCAGN